MESSEEDDDFPTHEWITPQAKIDSLYQSSTEKGIRKLCSELLDLKDAVENLNGNMQSKYLAFLRISEEVIEMEHELVELRKHITAQGILVQDLMSGVCRELGMWTLSNAEVQCSESDVQDSGMLEILPDSMDEKHVEVLERIDVLLAEHKAEEALSVIEAEEKESKELVEAEDGLSNESSSYRTAFNKRKALLGVQFVELAEQPSISISELKKSLLGLLKLDKGKLAHRTLLKSLGSRLHRSIDNFISSCSMLSETYPGTLSQLVFSTIFIAVKESNSIFGDLTMYTNRLEEWAEWEIESFVHLVKQNAPGVETSLALCTASICFEASLSHCSIVESHGLKFSKLLVARLQPYIEEVLEMNYKRVRKMVFDLAEDEDTVPLMHQYGSPLSASATADIALTSSGKKFMAIVRDLVDGLTPLAIAHFGGSTLNWVSQLFDNYIETLVHVLPGPSEDDNLTDPKEPTHVKAETDAQQLALLGTAYTVADDLLPIVVRRIFYPQSEPANKLKEGSQMAFSSNHVDYKDWRRQLHNSLDKLRDHFCRQYVLSFIYSREGKARLDARIYLNGKSEDLYWDSDPLPSLPFQALFGRLQQLASVAGDVLFGKDKLQKNLLARLTETVVIWLSDEQEFWDVFEDKSACLQPYGLQQLILDMRFIVEIAVCGSYPHKNIQQRASAIIARAIQTFSTRGLDIQNALVEDEWFTDTAKAAMNKLLLGRSPSESSEVDEDHIHITHDDVSISSGSLSSLSSEHSVESFVSATAGEVESSLFSDDHE